MNLSAASSKLAPDKNHNVKLAWGTDFMFNPAQNKNQNTDILKLKTWLTPVEVLTTSDPR